MSSAQPALAKRDDRGLNTIPLWALLIACNVIIFVLPVLKFPVVEWIRALVFTAIVGLATSITSPNNKRVILVAVSVILFEWVTNFTDFVYLHYASELVTDSFIIWVVVSFVLQIMKRRQVSLYTLIEALVGYLLLGIMFTALVTFVDLHTENAFSGVLDTGFDRGYFTLITMTTTGYGDITPITPIAKSLSLLIAISGQFYVAVIVAIIVGKYSNRLLSESTKG
ncbi:MAG: potassium channel family protein [Cyclobacteriaceae bacterium]